MIVSAAAVYAASASRGVGVAGAGRLQADAKMDRIIANNRIFAGNLDIGQSPL
jgi:hypothetical protein